MQAKPQELCGLRTFSKSYDYWAFMKTFNWWIVARVLAWVLSPSLVVLYLNAFLTYFMLKMPYDALRLYRFDNSMMMALGIALLVSPFFGFLASADLSTPSDLRQLDCGNRQSAIRARKITGSASVVFVSSVVLFWPVAWFLSVKTQSALVIVSALGFLLLTIFSGLCVVFFASYFLRCDHCGHRTLTVGPFRGATMSRCRICGATSVSR